MAVAALLLALLLLVAGILASNERRAGITGAAAGIAASSGFSSSSDTRSARRWPREPPVAAAPRRRCRSLWSALLGDLRDLNVALCFAGAVVAGASASLLRPADAGERLRALVATLEREPRTTPGKVARGLALSP